MKRIPIPALAALLAVLLTATAVFAARPEVFGAPRPAATQPVVIVPDETDPPSASPTVAPTEADEADETAEPSDADEDEGADEAEASARPHPTNHGQIVSEAAQATTPAGCKNHGEYVSLVARGYIDPSVSPAPDASGSVCDVNPKRASASPDASEKPKGLENAAKHASPNGLTHGKGHGKPR